MHGYGIIVWPEGDIFEGTFFEDKKCGFGIYYNQNKIYIANWKNNKPDGDVIIINNDYIRKQFWENGKPVRYLKEGQRTVFDKYVDIIKREHKKKKNQ